MKNDLNKNKSILKSFIAKCQNKNTNNHETRGYSRTKAMKIYAEKSKEQNEQIENSLN